MPRLSRKAACAWRNISACCNDKLQSRKKERKHLKRIQLAPQVYLNLLPAEKFNRCRFTVQLRYPARRDNATACALLPYLLERGYADYPDLTALSRRLAALYGASLSVNTSASGACRALTVSVDGIQQQFALRGEQLAQEYARLALGVMFRPALRGGMFDPAEVEIEKKQMAEELASEINDKRVYCLRQARRKFFGDDPAGIERQGYAEEVPGLTAHSVTEAWRWIVSCARVEIFCSGLNGEQAAEMVLAQLQDLDRQPQPLPVSVPMPPCESLHFVEKMDMVQAKLCLLFTVEDFETGRDLPAMRLAMAVLGGSPTSRLFMNVREKQSLCYYCAASFNSFGGVMCIDSGIEPENARRAEEAILAEWRDLCENPVSAEELEDARRFTINALAAVGDSISAQENWYNGQLWRDNTDSPAQVREQLQQVTAEDVRQAMAKFRFSLSYLLTKEDDCRE